MKKRASYLMALTLVLGSCLIPWNKVSAQEISDQTIYSEGYTEMVPYGVYLQAGRSNISKVGNGKIHASGTTFGRTTVPKISVGVRVERLIGNAWVQQDYFSASQTNNYTVTAAKTLTVPIGYFYRVKSFHTAHTDSSSSVTEGLYI